MKLSSAPIVIEYRDKLAKLRALRDALIKGSTKPTVWVMVDGENLDLVSLLGPTNIKRELVGIITDEVGNLIRQIEAHGVVVDI